MTTYSSITLSSSAVQSSTTVDSMSRREDQLQDQVGEESLKDEIGKALALPQEPPPLLVSECTYNLAGYSEHHEGAEH